jgi:hypothetical protein
LASGRRPRGRRPLAAEVAAIEDRDLAAVGQFVEQRLRSLLRFIKAGLAA